MPWRQMPMLGSPRAFALAVRRRLALVGKALATACATMMARASR